MWRLFSDTLQTISALVTIFIFLSGVSSIPGVFGGAPRDALLRTDVLNSLFNSWLAIASGRLMLLFAEKMDIGNHDAVYWAILLLVLLPMVVWANMLFLVTLFGDALRAQSLAVGACSIATTFIFTFNWLVRVLNEA
jgi:hypothetical protein